MNLDRFYETFIARDLFAKIVPGGILLLAILWWINGGKLDIRALVKDLPSWSWLFIYGVCYAVGFAVQELGELVLLWSAHPTDETYEIHLERSLQFERFEIDQRGNNATNGRTRERLGILRERLVVLKEMGGNVAISSLMALLIWVCVSRQPAVFCNGKMAIMAGFILLAISCLYWLHVKMRWRQRELELWVLNPNDPIEEHPATGWLIALLFILVISIATETWYFGHPLWCSEDVHMLVD